MRLAKARFKERVSVLLARDQIPGLGLGFTDGFEQHFLLPFVSNL